MLSDKIKTILEIAGVIISLTALIFTYWNTKIAKRNSLLAEENTAVAKKNVWIAEQNAALARENFQITQDNRRNALREHLFKEQLEFIKSFYGYISNIIAIIEKTKLDGSLSTKNANLLEDEIDMAYNFIDQHSFLLDSEKIADLLLKVIDEADNLYYDLIEKALEPHKADSQKFFSAYYAALEEIRDHYEIVELSAENKAIIQSARKRNQAKKA